MIILRNRWGAEDEIWNAVLDVLLDFLQQTQVATANEKKELYLISPWMTNFTLSLQGRGYHMETLERPYSRLGFADILMTAVRKIVEDGMPHEIYITCRPPHDLIPGRVLQMLETERDLTEHVKLFLVEQACSQKATIDLLYSLHTVDPDWKCVRVAYDEKLHAKIICSPELAVVGSPNLTYSGMYLNNEVAQLLTDQSDVDKIRSVCQDMWKKGLKIWSYSEGERDEYFELKERFRSIEGLDVRLKELKANVVSLHETGESEV